MPAGHTYIMGSASGTLYIGTFEGFSKTYGCTLLLHSETYDDIRTASNSKAGAAKRN